MSRVGKVPVQLSAGVSVDVTGSKVVVKGPKGVLEKEFNNAVSINAEDAQVYVKPINDSKFSRAMWGTARSIINSMVKGVTEGFTRELEVNGVGYRAAVKGDYINLTLGKSHNTKILIPKGIKVDTPKQNIIILESIDKHSLGQFVSIIKNQRPPEPYKGKGIKLKGEYVQRKEGKKG